ncbi:MAG: hypothetical protein AAF657_40125, partial [Acidobacteriota bacterium]
MRKRDLSGGLILAMGLAACAPAPEETPPPTAKPAPPPRVLSTEPIPASNTDREALRSTARRLAGLPVEAADPAAPEAEAWARHAESMEAMWTELEARHLSKMRHWAATDLTLADPPAPLFYPFSGPDLPSALQFFPQASSYVLVGLELPGKIPDLGALGIAELEVELERLRTGLANLVEAGYFVTKRMETDFVAPHLDGVLPVLYLFLARAGLDPQAVQFISLDAQGHEEPLESASETTATAVRIDLAGEPARSVYYFARDLSNAGLAAAPAFEAFLGRLGAFNVYMKSASYLLHMDDFTQFKAMLLATADAVLQDDSGLPIRDLSPDVWETQLLGTYTGTLPTYREWQQDDLVARYEQVETSPLPFAIGYNSRIAG